MEDYFLSQKVEYRIEKNYDNSHAPLDEKIFYSQIGDDYTEDESCEKIFYSQIGDEYTEDESCDLLHEHLTPTHLLDVNLESDIESECDYEDDTVDYWKDISDDEEDDTVDYWKDSSDDGMVGCDVVVQKEYDMSQEVGKQNIYSSRDKYRKKLLEKKWDEARIRAQKHVNSMMTTEGKLSKLCPQRQPERNYIKWKLHKYQVIREGVQNKIEY